MALSWIRVDNDLPDHPKSLALDVALGVDRSWTHVVQLWLWTSRVVPTGDLSKMPDAVIASRAGWKKDASVFVDALRQVGFLDSDGMLHDWHEYQGKMLERLEKDRERKRKPSKDSAGNPTELRRKSDGSPTEVQRTSTGNPLLQYETVRDGTVRDETKNEEHLSSADDAPAQGSLIETAPPKAKRDREAEITRVLTYWRSIHATPASAIEGKAGEKRRARVRARLAEGTTADECILALDGALKDPWLMGTDPKSTKAYRDVDTILRDRLQIEKLIGLVLPAGPRSQIASTGQRGAFPTPGVGSVREERDYSKPPPPKPVLPEWTAEAALARALVQPSFAQKRLTVPFGKSLPDGFQIPDGVEVVYLPDTGPKPLRLQDIVGAP